MPRLCKKLRTDGTARPALAPSEQASPEQPQARLEQRTHHGYGDWRSHGENGIAEQPRTNEAGSSAAQRPAVSETQRETDVEALREAALRKFSSRITGSGELEFPACPSLIDHYLDFLELSAHAICRPVTSGRARLRRLLLEKLELAFKRSSAATVTVKYCTSWSSSFGVDWTISINEMTMEDHYQEWVQTREPPLFGIHPDARLMSLVRTLGPSECTTCLDVGAGTGRNTLPLARAGFSTDAVEPSAPLADQLEEAIRSEGLPSRVVRGDFLSRRVELPRREYRLVVVSEVIPHFRDVRMLGRLFDKLAKVLEPGGVALLNMFVAADGYVPDKIINEVSQVAWSRAFTRKDIGRALAGLPLTLVSDEQVYSYEREHLPQWPPTSWYETWTSGRDLFDLEEGSSPIELRWLTYRRGE
jgi:SAM-dependent methyltransferase